MAAGVEVEVEAVAAVVEVVVAVAAAGVGELKVIPPTRDLRRCHFRE